ncbi:FHA domain-containing protein, partial [Methanospirillum sp.]|uniref:FHA domain-containing protein n=1 Tax=Methanospirillum sp. TaxID=45200 RepID=UPI002C21C911
GVSDDPANQGQPVFYYSLIPDGLKHAAENLSLFTSVAGNINPDLSRQAMAVQTGFQQIVHISGPGILITNGPRAGEVIRLTGNLYRIGRREEGWNGTTPEPAILLDDEYRSVSRVSKPHAWLKKQAGFWTITDGKSKGGTYVNGKPIGHDPVVLTNGDRVDLSPGPLGVSMIFYADTTSSDTAP